MTHEQGGQAATATDVVHRSRVQEGPRNHLISFAISIALTALAFFAVIYADVLETWFVVGFLIFLAFFQAVIQALFWMHMKDKGHVSQRIFLTGGVIVTITAVIMALFWCWW